MKAYDELWGLAEDNFGIITSAQAEELGVPRQNMRKMREAGVVRSVWKGGSLGWSDVRSANDL